MNDLNNNYSKLCKTRANEISKLNQTIEEKVIEEMNRSYAVIHTKSTYILIEKDGNTFVLDSRASFIHWHENNFFEDSKGKTQNKAKFWLKHPQRRTYKNLIFDPVTPGHHDGNYNIFSGFSVEPKQGDCSLYWYHVKEVVCGGNEADYLYVRKWMASAIQNPKLLATALVLKGLQGTGKNIFVEFFGRIFGPYYLTINSLKHLVGNFNSHLQNAYLIFANEAIWGGDKREIGALKAIITDVTILIEAKGKDVFSVQNCRHLIICSNEDWVVHMDLDDRRFFCLEVSSKHKEDTSYFKSLISQMENGGTEALMYDLLNEDLKDFDPRIMPSNDTGFDMKMRSASSPDGTVAI